MPLVTDYRAVKEIYADAAERRIGLPVFCCEDRETLEAILAAALEMGERLGVEDLPIIPAWTGRYPGRPQLRLVTACGDPVVGMHLMLSDLDAFQGETSPYRKLRVLPHLDHGLPGLDDDLLEACPDRFASIMFDASARPFEENLRLTAQYVERVQGRVVMEGAVDEIRESGGGPVNEPTSVERARRFLAETGVDVLVPNVGTEHRAAADQVRYQADRARELRDAVGRILCLHGTSSLAPEDLPQLPDDGFIKINVYTTLAVAGGQAVARQVLHELGSLFSEEQLRGLVEQGTLGPAVLAGGPLGPRLAAAANPVRRDAWFAAVRRRCLDFMEAFNYAAFAAR